MRAMTIILGIFLFALVTSILYMIGLKKKMTEEQDLSRKLLHKASLRVLDYLKSHDKIGFHEIDPLIKDLRAKNFYSSKIAHVQESKEFKEKLLDFMIEKDLLVEGIENGKKVYRLP